MRVASRGRWAGLLLIAGIGAGGTPPACAQGLSASRSLGGYGAAASSLIDGMGAGGPIIPYAGNFGGFMPYRMGGGSGGLVFSSRNTSVIGGGRTSFRLSPGYTGMSMRSGGMGQGFGARTRAAGSLGLPGAMGPGVDNRQPMGGGGSNVMPPNFGYPFYQPPSWSAADSSGAGMSPM